MHQLFSIVILLVILINSTSIAQNSTYHKDAIQLAARLTTDKATSSISEHLIYSIEDALVAVSEDPSIAANAVTYRYDIHASEIANVSNIRIIIGKESDWGKDLSQNPIQRTFPAYDLKLEVVETTDAYIVLDASSTKPLNMRFVANEISILDGVWMVELPGGSSTDSDIKLRVVEEGYIITYSYQTGDCLGSCDEVHYWEFGVEHNGNVTFLGEHGADLAANSNRTEEDFFTQLDALRP
ncbi:hypothetical protein [Aureispira anguillae]|uniref:Uncharacterized protein n=1 Tax=Aureispira anguillae TaxID=2864201 RepID=A0A915YI96_9BACT|nr:hypothetical protein [Aureispira anguillae]BDS13471.1 hypothetical protein AsAng_0042090 [Aureispira anguillae]